MFQTIVTKQQLAALLKVNFKKHLVYYLYRLPNSSRYKTFSLPKKSGGFREISAPATGLKTVQRRLAAHLLEVYKPRGGVHAYVRDRSIQTNAEQHVGARYVLNIDLKDFFSSINFGRVYGIFRAKPYLASPAIAAVLAQICCHDEVLPQGAPTSPIVSNMICAGMDARLRELARENKCTYTRYCDDITFSTNQRVFPEKIAFVEGGGDSRTVTVGASLEKVIVDSGFSINSSKTRLLTKSDRQDVTGLVVNQFVNVKRTYIRNLRAALHAWRKFGLEKAQKEFSEKFDTGGKSGTGRVLERVLKGRIQFVGTVRGFDDKIYEKLRDEFNELCADKIKVHENSWQHKIENAVWVIEDEASIIQGTAFFIEQVGLVTCAHCVGSQPFIYHPENPTKKFNVEIVAKNDDFDLAILKPLEMPDGTFTALAKDKMSKVRREAQVTLVGYPNHAPGKHLRIEGGEVTSLQQKSAVDRFNITASIVAGNSGGPVLSRGRRVIGVAVTGADNDDDVEKTEERGVIPIKMLDQLEL